MIYFSSELIAKSIWSREKTSTQACHEKQGNRGSFLSQPVQPGEAGREEGAAALSVQEGQICQAQWKARAVHSLVIPLWFFLAHPVRKKSKSEKPTMGIKCRLSNLSVHKKNQHQGIYLKCRFPSTSLQSLFH